MMGSGDGRLEMMAALTVAVPLLPAILWGVFKLSITHISLKNL